MNDSLYKLFDRLSDIIVWIAVSIAMFRGSLVAGSAEYLLIQVAVVVYAIALIIRVWPR
jgi:hypothetical protein